MIIVYKINTGFLKYKIKVIKKKETVITRYILIINLLASINIDYFATSLT